MDTNLLAQLIKTTSEQSGGGNNTALLVLIAIITALPPTLVSILGFLKAAKVESDVKQVHVAINSRLDEWLKVERLQGEAAGRAQTAAVVIESAVVPIALPKPMSPKECELMKLIDQLNHEIESLKTGGNQ